jgi:hypothetical protein
MAENGLDLRTWLTVVGVFVMFLGFPAASIAYDVRKKRRERDQRVRDASGAPGDRPMRTTS